MYRTSFFILTAIILVVTVSLSSGDVLAQSVPVPPCAGLPNPTAGAVGDSLNQLVWMEDELPADWSPPACTGWSAGPTKVLLAAAGRFRIAGDISMLAAQLTSISTMSDIVYWSSSRGKWRNLFKAAVTLSGPERDMRRDDFIADDFVPDTELYSWLEEDNPTAGVVYQTMVHERTPNRLVFETVNVSAVRASLLLLRVKIAGPGEMRQLYYIERESDDTWRYYTLIRMGRASGLAGTSAANYKNRAEAYFRYLTGQVMTREPPAAP